ncbi:hypothetical protein PMI15_01758 [Polaromonas sp. CF318]|uniref:hypothetical protein n=1 Tax=Polaromonas sp. CF318 TaxID=1144318 RepID=UPI0002714C36|nr:hypothetical protein [Polaromonas sp. CF318]EJL85513.1 hypothetical protein PMI15_01758 [Polaromonas sp. CF318]
MWSVWSETVDVYLGQGVAMLKAGIRETVVSLSPATLPLERVLARLVDGAAAAQVVLKKGSRLRVSLSGAWCPALAVTVPEGVTRWEERRQIALASAARDMGTDLEQIACEIDATAPGAAAAIALPLREELERWASQMGCRLVSVAPLWATATQSRLSRQRGTRSLLVIEPDAATLIASDGKNGFKTTTLPGEQDAASLQAYSQQWLQEHGHEESGLARLCFGLTAHPPMATAPRRWAGHWYSA